MRPSPPLPHQSTCGIWETWQSNAIENHPDMRKENVTRHDIGEENVSCHAYLVLAKQWGLKAEEQDAKSLG